MKRILTILVFLLTFSSTAFSQKIKENTVDKFTGQRAVSTSWEKINTGNTMTSKNHIFFRLHYEGNNVYFQLKWVSNEKIFVEENSQVIFKLNNDKMVSLRVLTDAKSIEGGGAIGFKMSGLEGIHLICLGNLDAFLDEKALANIVRIQTTKGNIDIDLKEKDTKKINDAYQLLKKEVGDEFPTAEDVDF